MSNPLVADVVDSTTSTSGLSLVESVNSTNQAIQNGDWLEAGLGTATLVMSALDPFATIISNGVGWLIEHVGPLSDALDALAGDPDEIQAHADTWRNVANEVNAVSVDLGNLIQSDVSTWTGAAADAYRERANDTANLILAAGNAAAGAAEGIELAGEVVTAVRDAVRDIIADVVGSMVSWALQVLFTLGIGLIWVVPKVVAKVAETAAKIAALTQKLVSSLARLSPMLKKLGDDFGAAGKGLQSIRTSRNADTHSVDAPPPITPSGNTGGGRNPDPLPTPNDNGPDLTPSGTRGGPDLTPAGTRGGLDGGPPPPRAIVAVTPSPSPSPPPLAAFPPYPPPPKPNPAPPPAAPSQSVPSPSKVTASDPIDVASGEMILHQVDVHLPALLAVVLARTHVSSYRHGRWFGPSWASTLDQRLEVGEWGTRYFAPDGMVLDYPPSPVDGTPVLPVAGPRWPLTVDASGLRRIGNRTHRWTLVFGTGIGTLPLVEIGDHHGQRITVERDAVGAPRTVRHSGGHEVAVITENGRITAFHVVGEPVARFSYDEQGQLVAVVNPSGLPLRFRYDEDGRIVRWENRNGTWYRYHYDEAGRCVRTEGAGGFLNGSFVYARGITRHTDSLGHTTTYRIDERGDTVAATDPLGRTTRTEYDEFHRLVARTDPLGATARLRYDDADNIVEINHPDGTRTRSEYDVHGGAVRVIQPDGGVWRRRFDDHGRVLESTDPLGASIAYGYDATGALASITDPLGNTTRFENNALGLCTARIDPLGARSEQSYNVFGQAETLIDEVGNRSVTSWSVDGVPLSLTTPDGMTRSWRHDGEGQVREGRNPLGGLTRIETTHFDLPTHITDPSGASRSYTYDTELRMTSMTNERGRVWTYRYNPAGELVSERDFDGREVRYVYDDAGRVVERSNAMGQVVRTTWDSWGRALARRHGDEEITFDYDRMGRVVRARTTEVDLHRQYDPRGRLVAEQVDGREMTLRYDAAGRRVGERTPTGAVTSRSYDAAGRLTALQTAGQSLGFTYDAAGREISRVLAPGVVLTHAWDAASRLIGQTIQTAGSRHTRSYGYRADGNLVMTADPLVGGRHYDLDPIGRVVGVRSRLGAERYSYDAAGDLDFSHYPGSGSGPREYTGSLLRRAGAVHYEHDREGRVVLRRQRSLSGKVRTWRYTWDAEDRMTSVATPDGERWRYVYDAFGRRVSKQRLDWDGVGVVERIDYTWADTDIVEQVRDEHTATTWAWAGEGRVLSQAERVRLADAPQSWVDQQFYNMVTDLVGSPTEMVAADGTVSWRSDRTLWGEGGSAPTPLRFPGQHHDPESGLHYNVHRYYDPAGTRYLSHDPLGLAAAPQSQGYVVNPLMWADPLGLSPKPGAGGAPSIPPVHSQPNQTALPPGHVALSGHGSQVNSLVVPPGVVPQGTTLTFHGKPWRPLDDAMGQQIETGSKIDSFPWKLAQPEVYGPGSAFPEHILHPPIGLDIRGNPITVAQSTRLSDLLQPNMGIVHWAACRTPTNRMP